MVSNGEESAGVEKEGRGIVAKRYHAMGGPKRFLRGGRLWFQWGGGEAGGTKVFATIRCFPPWPVSTRRITLPQNTGG